MSLRGSEVEHLTPHEALDVITWSNGGG